MTNLITNPLSLNRELTFHDAVADYAPATLFKYGRNAERVPHWLGLTVTVDNGEFNAGEHVTIGLAVARWTVEFEGTVKTCSVEEGTTIEGRDERFGSASMYLGMKPDVNGGSLIKYGIKLTASGRKYLAPLNALHGLLILSAPSFANEYKENIVRSIPDSEKLVRPGSNS